VGADIPPRSEKILKVLEAACKVQDALQQSVAEEVRGVRGYFPRRASGRTLVADSLGDTWLDGGFSSIQHRSILAPGPAPNTRRRRC
jgi:hypothetical protein